MKPDWNPMLPYEDEEYVRKVLAAAAAGERMQTPERVEQALMAAVRGRNRRQALGRTGAAAAIAAAVLAALTYSLPRPEPARVAERPVPPRVETAVVGEPPAVARNRENEPEPPRRARRVVPRAASRGPAPSRMRPQPAAEIAEFIPVGAWQAYEPMERGSIVRVRLPKATLPGLGIPVSADRWNESIPADVLLGEDGTMRAVRFVTTSQ